MTLRFAILAATILVGLAVAGALRHSVSWPRRPDVAEPYLRAQRSVRRYGALLGVIEGGALVALLIALFRVPADSTEMWLIGLAALCVATMLGVWAAWLRPLNVSMGAWPAEDPPHDWSEHHARWSRFHRLRVMLATIALLLLLMTLFARPAL
jgi:hypothetical protein